MKELFWYPASKTDYDDFPPEVKQDLGYQLYFLQPGETPDDLKPLKNLGKGISGVFKSRYRDENPRCSAGNFGGGGNNSRST